MLLRGWLTLKLATPSAKGKVVVNVAATSAKASGGSQGAPIGAVRKRGEESEAGVRHGHRSVDLQSDPE